MPGGGEKNQGEVIFSRELHLKEQKLTLRITQAAWTSLGTATSETSRWFC